MAEEARVLSEESEDESLVQEADRLELEGDARAAWFRASPRQRNLIKGRRHRQLKDEARKMGFDAERWVVSTPEERQRLRDEAGEQREARIRALVDKHDRKREEDLAPEVHTARDDLPATDPNPMRRAMPTVGEIEERVDDLVGERPPRTLADIYARWPLLGRRGGEDFYLRVEREYPKKFAGVDVAGYLGEIRVVCNEQQFGRYFGKGTYRLQLYGPDPRGRRDEDGSPRVKALTEVFTLDIPDHFGGPKLVPVPDPRRQKKQEDTMLGGNPLNPFGMGGGFGGVATPTTQADAAVHKTSLDFAASMMSQRQRDLEEREKQLRNADSGGTPPKHVFEFLGESTRAQVDAAQRDADARERLLRAQLEHAEQERRDLLTELRELKHDVEEARTSRNGDALEIVKLRDGDAQRLHDHYRQQMDNAQRSHDDQTRSLKEAHEEEIKRERDRFNEQRTYYDRQLDEERRRFEDREKTLKEEIERIRREERDQADKRVSDAEKRAEERLKDQERQHNRELSTLKETYESRVDNTKTKLEFELAHAKERLEDARADAQKAKDEAERAKDPVTAIKEFEAKAKELGLEKPDPEGPKSVWDRFASAAGSGVGQALARTDLATLAGALRGVVAPAGRPPAGMPGAPAHPQLPPGQRPPQPRGPSTRAMQWASDGAKLPTPVAQPPLTAPSANQPPMPRPAQAETPPVATTSTPPQPAPAAPVPAAPPTAPPPAAAAGPSIDLPVHPLRDAFGDQPVVDFIGNAEHAINTDFSPEEFARMFAGQFPEAAARLVRDFQPEDAVSFVKGIPIAVGSPILRRDGKKWLEKLWDSLRKGASPVASAPPPTG